MPSLDSPNISRYMISQLQLAQNMPFVCALPKACSSLCHVPMSVLITGEKKFKLQFRDIIHMLYSYNYLSIYHVQWFCIYSVLCNQYHRHFWNIFLTPERISVLINGHSPFYPSAGNHLI